MFYLYVLFLFTLEFLSHACNQRILGMLYTHGLRAYFAVNVGKKHVLENVVLGWKCIKCCFEFDGIFEPEVTAT